MEPIHDFGHFPANSPVTELARWAQDIANFNDGEHRVTVAEHDRRGYKVTFHYPNVELTAYADEVSGVPDLDRHGLAIGTCTEIEFTEAMTVGLAFEDFEPI